MVYVYGILLLILTVAMFYGFTILIKEVILRISKNRKSRYDNTNVNYNTSLDNNSKTIKHSNGKNK